ncbi:excisionase [Noviherbaspirillum sp. UKPF54]|uniref:excisionase n=1 Tax=Noviherbaspirillum sp. UKPF54 TaxID=2601898 RepID=UPI0011B17631|nr:excisionase [Noviherbaspirillum sp. UKPF54]QDZ28077.1 hypothetical protein FAY22_09030 [Noviherbaspirillum sp. UKPF54]
MKVTLELQLTRQPQACAAPARLTLQAWAEQVFGEYAPRYSTLRKWVLEGLISPPPQKDGWIWLVEADAEYKGKF